MWVKELADGSSTIGIFNISDGYKKIIVNFGNLGLEGQYKIRDLWRQINVGNASNSYSSNIPPHGVSLINVTKN
ncbi:MAG: hypothetical protein ABI472_11655 [Ginsengibacter sp.]